jgi:hypothetical protein
VPRANGKLFLAPSPGNGARFLAVWVQKKLGMRKV